VERPVHLQQQAIVGRGKMVEDLNKALMGRRDLAFDGAGMTLQETRKSIRLFGIEVLPRIHRISARASQSPGLAVAAAR
jgi:hypothetical protein